MQAPAHYEELRPPRRIAELGGDAAEDVVQYLGRDSIANLFMLSWLENYGICAPGRPDLFRFFALREERELVGVSLLITRRLALLNADQPEIARELADWYRSAGVRLEHIVSCREAVSPFWAAYAARGTARSRLVRDQELYEIGRAEWLRLHPVGGRARRVRLARACDLDAVFLASARMHAEETLEDPLTRDAAHFRRHVEHRIENGRTYAWFEGRRLLFKADISAQSSWGAQISGVYTPPALRGQGIATAAMTEICEELFERGFPRVTLYVNRTNDAARRVYQKVGFRYHTDYQTVFIEPERR